MIQKEGCSYESKTMCRKRRVEGQGKELEEGEEEHGEEP